MSKRRQDIEEIYELAEALETRVEDSYSRFRELNSTQEGYLRGLTTSLVALCRRLDYEQFRDYKKHPKLSRSPFYDPNNPTNIRKQATSHNSSLHSSPNKSNQYSEQNSPYDTTTKKSVRISLSREQTSSRSSLRDSRSSNKKAVSSRRSLGGSKTGLRSGLSGSTTSRSRAVSHRRVVNNSNTSDRKSRPSTARPAKDAMSRLRSFQNQKNVSLNNNKKSSSKRMSAVSERRSTTRSSNSSRLMGTGRGTSTGSRLTQATASSRRRTGISQAAALARAKAGTPLRKLNDKFQVVLCYPSGYEEIEPDTASDYSDDVPHDVFLDRLQREQWLPEMGEFIRPEVDNTEHHVLTAADL